MNAFFVEGNLIDIPAKKIIPARLEIIEGKIASVEPVADASFDLYIAPGFVDAHVHIESSMLIPSEFARLAVVHGTVATVSDPHEIANVCGMAGVDYMIENGNTVPFKFHFGAPSCVPATSFETAGAVVDASDIELLMKREEILYLSEMMNFPGVLNGDEDVRRKIDAAKKNHKPVDGHAPGLRGEAVRAYISAGISTDHECFTKDEALEKLQYGMKIIIREGSAAKNFEALWELLNEYPDKVMFCSDDKHPDSLVEGHINQLCARAVEKGVDIFHVLQAACVNPVAHYKLPVGQLRKGDPADFIVLKNLQDFTVAQTYVMGQLVAENGKSLIGPTAAGKAVNHFSCEEKTPEDFIVTTGDYPLKDGKMPVIEALNGQLITNRLTLGAKVFNQQIVSDTEEDILKIVVVNRYAQAPVAKAFIRNFGLKSGAIASSVAHDSHNIVAVGVDDECICRAVNLVIRHQGGVSLVKTYHNDSEVNASDEMILPLPVAGLMSTDDGYEVAAQYAAIDKAAKASGSTLAAPYMTLSFMALLVIPHLKLSDLGLFDGSKFEFVK